MTACWRGALSPGKHDSGGGKEFKGLVTYKLRIAGEDALKGSIIGEMLIAALKTARSSGRRSSTDAQYCFSADFRCVADAKTCQGAGKRNRQ